jgi:hypothetical protein
VRRYLSRFPVVVVIALPIESLVAVVQARHERPEMLAHAAAVTVGAAILLAAWGVRLTQSDGRRTGTGSDRGSEGRRPKGAVTLHHANIPARAVSIS